MSVYFSLQSLAMKGSISKQNANPNNMPNIPMARATKVTPASGGVETKVPIVDIIVIRAPEKKAVREATIAAHRG